MSNAQQNLREPERTDWDNAYKGSKYAPPPPAYDDNGKPIVYQAKLKEIKEVDADEGYLNFQADFTLVDHPDVSIRGWISARPFMRRNRETGELEPMKGNPNKLGSLLKASGVAAKPQSNSEYRAAVKAINGRAIPLTIDWEARNKDLGETVRGYYSFPKDEQTGMRKAILKKGDLAFETDAKNNITGTHVVESEVLFANARLRYFIDQNRK